MRAKIASGATAAIMLAVLALGTAEAGAGGGTCHGPSTDGTGTVVEMKANCFGPTVLHVAAGETVTFANGDSYPHTVTGVGRWGSGFQEIPGQGAVRVTFEREGVYAYTCVLHPGMSGAVVVGSGIGPATGGGLAETLVEPGPGAQAGSAPRADAVEEAAGGSGSGLPVAGASGIAAAAGLLGLALGRRLRRPA